MIYFLEYIIREGRMELILLDVKSISGRDEAAVKERFPARFSKAMRFLRETDRLEAIGAGLLLLRVLGADESMIETDANGRPRIPGGPEFSLSHSHGRCLIAAAEKPVGADIEKIDGDALLAARAALSEEELLWIREDPAVRFTLLWTRKESLYKAAGGYGDPRCIPSLDGRIPEGLFVRSAVSDGFAISVCSAEDPGRLRPKYLI